MAMTDHNGAYPWRYDDDFVPWTFDNADQSMELFDSVRPGVPVTQGDLTPPAVVNTLYGPGAVNP